MAGKTVVGLVWIYGVLEILGMGLPLGFVAKWAVIFMVVAHAIECVVFLPRMKAAGGSLGHHIVQVMLFGVFHANTLPKAPAQ
jgi:uncharacterized protein YhhL (DUF1145 family)